jgi:hypothetical protein
MSEEKNIIKKDEPAGLSNAEMTKMLLDTQRQLVEALNKQSKAIAESRVPYVDPSVLEQQKADTEERRRMVEMEARRKAATKRVCPHQRENGTSNIKWHEHSNGITKGVCGTCFSEFDTSNVNDLKLLRQDLKSIKQMGRAGAHARRGAILDA